MKKNFTLTILLLFLPLYLFATHNRAGEITFELISGYTYKVTITTFTYTLSVADRDELNIDWGDNTTSVVPRVQKVELPNYYYHNTYTANHTFPGPGIYTILMQDPNRNYGINNIPNSVNVIFSIKTVFIINPAIGENNTPELLNFPIDKAALGHIFIHNPAAYDPDGDSLSYTLTACTGQDGLPISNYELPAYSDTIYVDPVSGDLVWYTPVDTGRYNVAMLVEEWRNGIKISSITRDMQIDVHETDNNPPVNSALSDYCVVAGDLIEFQVTSTDLLDNDSVHHNMVGGPFILDTSPATFTNVAKDLGFITSTFRWQTSCDHIRLQPYQITLKSEDVNNDIELVDIDNFQVRVLAPAPENLITSANSNEINLSWDQSDCGPVAGYYIYRREGMSGYIPDSCETGVPSSAGYVKIQEITGKANTSFSDDNGGAGLVQGVNYCYIVTAYYPDGAESIASEEVCASLVPGFPAILNVSVTDVNTSGSIYLAWIRPRNFDSIAAPGPYVYKIYRSDSDEPYDFIPIDSTFSLNDTVYTDTPLNTEVTTPYFYTVRLFNNTLGNRFEIKAGENEIASSLYIEITPDDNLNTLVIKKKAPWINSDYVIYRKTTAAFDSIDFVSTNIYEDSGLKNGQEYCYQSKSLGWREIEGITYTNINYSHVNCATPLDITPPCPPVLDVESNCDSLMNILRWTNPNNSCCDDVVRYNIYYAGDIGSEPDSLTSVSPAEDTIYYHKMSEDFMLAGCYVVTAIDSFENESAYSAKICVDNCILYELPNVFTPNNDNVYDLFVSRNRSDLIEKVDMKIFDRYGQLVYSTSDPAINWDGSYRDSDKKVDSGVYYYICDVYEPRISGIEIRTIVGFIHLYAEGYAGETITK